jgi:superfamily II DNA/RNA helicase
MTSDPLSRDDLAAEYLDQIEFEPYPVQENGLLAWFTSDQGVLVCAPTGMGKTLIAEAALFEALKTGRRAYYTTPLIALTEQKLQEMQVAAQRWGFSADDVGLVTGNRQVNPGARILVVVAEILFNRLLHPEEFEFSDVSAVVMDEFHSFNDPERGMVWELTFELLPKHIRLLLLSATVGNAFEFRQWLNRSHERRLELVESNDRCVPLTYEWVGDMLLNEQLEVMAAGDDLARRVPALVFCFNRDECWNIADQLKGKKILADGQQQRLSEELKKHDWSEGAGPKLKQILQRGVGVHHAGLLPKYKRIVESLFQKKLLSFTICTETLAAGINLPARSVVVPKLLTGPPDNKRLIAPSAASQMFGRAGRPQFDDHGYVYAVAHEDDVRMLRWREKYDQIPEDTKDLGLRKAKKALKKKMPKRRANEKYWTEAQFEQLRQASPSKLESRAQIPWRLFAYLLEASPEIERIRTLVSKRLMPDKKIRAGLRNLNEMVLTLWRAGYVSIEPEPTATDLLGEQDGGGQRLSMEDHPSAEATKPEEKPAWRAELAHPTPAMEKLRLFRSVNPLLGVFLVNQLGIADRNERLQVLEGVLEIAGSVGRHVRVPPHEELPPGPLAMTRLDGQLLQMGLATVEEISGQEDDEEDSRYVHPEERVWVLTLADKLLRLFQHEYPAVTDVGVFPVWVAGELVEFGGDFNKYVTSKGLQKQEGVIFRHLLRLILLIGEFTQLCPPDTTEEEWRGDLSQIREVIIESCHRVDPSSTDKTLESEGLER